MANVYHKGDLVISAGTVYDDARNPGRLVASAEGGKVVEYYEDEAPLTDVDKQRIADFVAEAAAAPEN